VVEKLYAGSRDRPENFALWDKIREFSRIIFSFGPLSREVAEKPRLAMASSLVPFCGVFMLDETSYIRLSVCSAVSKL